MSEIMEIAKASAAVKYDGPNDSSLLYEQLIEGLASQHKTYVRVPVILWQDVLDARGAYAAALGRAVETLTKAEKQLAWMNHVMEKLG